jgi:BlaI family transcriptional regulator, penicillinase repressor
VRSFAIVEIVVATLLVAPGWLPFTTTACCSIVYSSMAAPKLTRLELQIMKILWEKGPCAIRELQEGLKGRPAYTTVQTVVYRLEWKKAVRRTKKVANAHIFEAAISRDHVQHRMIDELIGLFGGRALPVMAHLIDSGKLTREEVREAQSFLRERAKKDEGK